MATSRVVIYHVCSETSFLKRTIVENSASRLVEIDRIKNTTAVLEKIGTQKKTIVTSAFTNNR